MNRRTFLLSTLPALSGLLVLVLCFTSMAIRVSDMPRLSTPGARTIKLDVGKYILYAEGDDDAPYADMQCTVRDATGASLDVHAAKYGPSYDTLAHSGRSAFEVFVQHPGEHTAACTMRAAAHGTVAIGRNVGITILIGVVTLILGVVASLVLAFVMHRRHARAPTA